MSNPEQPPPATAPAVRYKSFYQVDSWPKEYCGTHTKLINAVTFAKYFFYEEWGGAGSCSWMGVVDRWGVSKLVSQLEGGETVVLWVVRELEGREIY